MLTFLSFSVSKENIEHEVTDCTFCDCKVKRSVSLAEFLSFLENITVEKTEDVKRIDIDRIDPCVLGRHLTTNWSTFQIDFLNWNCHFQKHKPKFWGTWSLPSLVPSNMYVHTISVSEKEDIAWKVNVSLVLSAPLSTMKLYGEGRRDLILTPSVGFLIQLAWNFNLEKCIQKQVPTFFHSPSFLFSLF